MGKFLIDTFLFMCEFLYVPPYMCLLICAGWQEAWKDVGKFLMDVNCSHAALVYFDESYLVI